MVEPVVATPNPSAVLVKTALKTALVGDRFKNLKLAVPAAGLFALLFGAMATMNSCSKELPVAEADSRESALVAVHNFALLVPSNLTVMLNNANLSVLGAPASIAYGGNLSGPYAGVKPGATTIGLRTLTGTADLVSKSANLVASSATSVLPMIH